MLVMAVMFPLTLMAQQQDGAPEQSRRDKWFKEMQAKKHDYFIRRLELTDEQQEPFFAVYDKMERDLRAIDRETRELERSVSEKAEATDAEHDAAIDAVYSQRYREWVVETKAKEELSLILTRKQMLDLKRVEFEFTRALMKHRRQFKDRKNASR